MVGAATSCQLPLGARREPNQQRPASLGLPSLRLLSLPCPTAAGSGTPGFPASPVTF
jgi:hypothetical protein